MLKPCPCGETPTALEVRDGDTFRWRRISGDCCGLWELEVRVVGWPDEGEILKGLERDWNEAPRAGQGSKP